MDLTQMRALGRSGLLVSPLALGAMTFGAGRWGADEAGSRAVFDADVDRGGNFVDTADIYSGGESEAMPGRFIAERSLRERIFGGPRGDPLAVRHRRRARLKGAARHRRP